MKSQQLQQQQQQPTLPHTQVSNNKKPPTITYIKEFVKLTGHTYDCNNLTIFEYAAHAITGNGN